MKLKELERLVEDARRWTGWRVEQVKKGWMVYPPDKSMPGILIHRTPSDWRADRNIMARLRRAGAPI